MNAKYLLALFTSCIFACSAVWGKDTSNDMVMEKLQGRWDIVGGVNQGRELTKPELAGTVVTVTNNLITTYDGKQEQRFNAIFTLDETKQPIQISMTSVPAVARVVDETLEEKQVVATEVVALGILKFDDKDKCTLCYTLPGGEQPTKFESPAGSKRMLFRLERAKSGEELLETVDPVQE